MIDTAPFGRTGHDSTRVIFGGAALGAVSHEESERALELLLEYGVNHLDTAPSYGDSELRIASLAEAPPRPLLPRDEDRQARLPLGEGAAASLAGAARRRRDRSHPAPQPRRRDRLGVRPRT